MERYHGKINILRLIDGARQARGLTVVIDVFRAFSLECYLYDMGIREIRPVGSIEDTFALNRSLTDSILIGERHGKKCDGFDFGNSPSSINPEAVKDKIAIHTTSAGTQGIVNATRAEEIITGSLVNAKAIAAYILKKQPEEVSLVCMGTSGVRSNPEDELCAEYIKSLLEGCELPDIEQRVHNLQRNGGEHFFDENKQEIFPEADFWLCTMYNRFPFVILIHRDKQGYFTRKENVL